MIAPLRRRHRLMATTLLVAVPVLYVLALLARPAEPVMETLPAGFANAVGEGQVLFAEDDLFVEHRIAVRLRSDSRGPVLELEPMEPLALPDVLVYWSPSRQASPGLPGDAYLVGALAAGASFSELPPAAARGGGRVVLYSLGHKQVVAAAELPEVRP